MVKIYSISQKIGLLGVLTRASRSLPNREILRVLITNYFFVVFCFFLRSELHLYILDQIDISEEVIPRLLD